MNIPDKATEAAAKARYSTIRGGVPWSEADEVTRNSYMADVRREVEAAAPFIAAQALRDFADWQDAPVEDWSKTHPSHGLAIIERRLICEVVRHEADKLDPQ